MNDLSISVIIPTLNEADCIAQTIAKTRQIGECEIIVVDGYSKDDTCQQAMQADYVMQSQPGRARQQNAGAAVSRGDVLLFLHADCKLSANAFSAMRTALQNPDILGGCFDQHIDAPGSAYRWLEWGNRKRVQFSKWAYGDQGIFVRKHVFEQIDGFPQIALMEDLYFMKRLRKLGRFELLHSRIHVSPRRWQKYGIVRQTLRNWILLTLAHLGVSPDRLARYYYIER